jgi:sortase A
LVFSSIFFQAQIVLADEAAKPTSIPTRLIIPAISLDEAVVPVGLKEVKIEGKTYYQWLTDDNRVGWHNLSAPLGQVGNTVLNGHSDINAKVFQDLPKVEIGDELIVCSDNQVYRYVVTEKFLVQEKGVSLAKRIENAQLIMPTPDERLTLITCAQPGATHRLVVIARRVLEH